MVKSANCYILKIFKIPENREIVCFPRPTVQNPKVFRYEKWMHPKIADLYSTTCSMDLVNARIKSFLIHVSWYVFYPCVRVVPSMWTELRSELTSERQRPPSYFTTTSYMQWCQVVFASQLWAVLRWREPGETRSQSLNSSTLCSLEKSSRNMEATVFSTR